MLVGKVHFSFTSLNYFWIQISDLVSGLSLTL
jgi:hypothetical protein